MKMYSLEYKVYCRLTCSAGRGFSSLNCPIQLALHPVCDTKCFQCARGWVLALRTVTVLCEGAVILLAAVFLSVTFHICSESPGLLSFSSDSFVIPSPVFEPNN
jgi:hypothetical protein